MSTAYVGLDPLRCEKVMFLMQMFSNWVSLGGLDRKVVVSSVSMYDGAEPSLCIEVKNESISLFLPLRSWHRMKMELVESVIDGGICVKASW